MAKKQYDKITTLKNLDSVRHRPGMYVGSIGSVDGKMPEALVQIFQETISNSIDEALSGYGDTIDITIHPNNAMTIADHGRGIPMGDKFDHVIRSFTVLHSSGKFDSDAYSRSGGLNGVGLKATTALSTQVDAKVVREDVAYEISFQQEKVVKKSHRKPKRGEKTGTSITFHPDDTVFDMIDWNLAAIKRKINNQSYLTPTITYTLVDERVDTSEGEENTFVYHHADGIKDLVIDTAAGADIVGSKDALLFKDTALFDKKKFVGLADQILEEDDNLTPIDVEVSLAYTENIGESIIAYTNGIPNKDHGYHVDGAKKGIHSALQEFATNKKILKRNEKFSEADSREGIVLVVSVGVPESIIDFKGQTKGELSTVQAKQAVQSTMEKHFGAWLYENEKQAKEIVEKAKDASAARAAAREARVISQQSRKKNSKKDKLEMSTKLVPGRGEPKYRELFIVEGDSAAGSVIKARTPEIIKGKKVITQGVLPIRGKILNVSKEPLRKILANEEISTIIGVLGTGFGEDFDIGKLQYDKIIICSDADHDGFHIRALLVNILWKLFPQLVEQGHVYIANPPLFRFKTYKKGKAETRFALDNKEYEQMKKKYGDWDVVRLKGLGEMDAKDLSETTITRGKRRLTQLTVEDATDLSKALNLWFSDKNSAKRRSAIEENVYIDDDEDI